MATEYQFHRTLTVSKPANLPKRPHGESTFSKRYLPLELGKIQLPKGLTRKLKIFLLLRQFGR